MCAQGVANEVPKAAAGSDPSALTTSAPAGSSSAVPTASADGSYEYVARSGKVSLAIAESRGPDRTRARQVTDRALEKLSACMRQVSQESREISPGAARVILQLSEHGDVVAERVVAGKESSYIVVRCLLPALKLQNYGPSKNMSDSRSLGIAFEAIWES